MTGADILLLANYHTENETIGANTTLKFINEWLLMDLAGDAGIEDTEDIEISTADTWADLPTGFIEETEISQGGSPYWGKFYGDNYRGDYDVRNGQIRFPKLGTYTIHFIRRPKPIDSLDDEPEVNEVFHYCCSLYVAMRYKYYDDEDSQDAERLRKEYEYYREKAVQEHKKIAKGTTRVSKISRVRPQQ